MRRRTSIGSAIAIRIPTLMGNTTTIISKIKRPKTTHQMVKLRALPALIPTTMRTLFTSQVERAAR
ncbi:hypothetical protein [Anatilimnocola aggregata]|uniref:hypothetical protein n=1 Tax=Anatilimnocola aggregata TaxID=2528021 RepID=UPI0011A54757|nr:hypothetical protein [Anatilimnocola aggregata]